MVVKKKVKKKQLNKQSVKNKDKTAAVAPHNKEDKKPVDKVNKVDSGSDDNVMKLTAKEWRKIRPRFTQALIENKLPSTLKKFQTLLDELEVAVSDKNKSMRNDHRVQLNILLKKTLAKHPEVTKPTRKKLLDIRHKEKVTEIGVTKAVKADFLEAFKRAKSNGRKLKNQSHFVELLLEHWLLP